MIQSFAANGITYRRSHSDHLANYEDAFVARSHDICAKPWNE